MEHNAFGLIFHWGLYSVPAYDDEKSARRRRTQNGSEWYLKRLVEDGSYRPISGYKETQAFHEKNYGKMTYQHFADLFTASKFNPDDWMKLAKEIGASYVILTARHHDGFTLWPSKTTPDYNSVSKGPHRDLLREFIDSGRKFNLKVGIYYSWLEFDIPITIKYMNDVIVPQMTELMEYDPDIWWFDGGWAIKSEYAKKKIEFLLKSIREKNPKVEINDRLGIDFKDENDLGSSSQGVTHLSTYRVYSDRAIPEIQPGVPWEHINTIGLSWGRNKYQTYYKSPEELFTLYTKVQSLGGRFLLNLGPNEDGTLDSQEEASLRGFGYLLSG